MDTDDPATIAEQVSFNQWFKGYADQPLITLLDNSAMSVEEASRHVAAWINEIV